MKKDDSIYVEHIITDVKSILDYTYESTQNDFLNNPMMQDAVIRQFEIIGEATKRLSIEFRDKHEDIPLQNIAGMRDKLIHEYFAVNSEIVWETTQTDVPVLLIKLEKL